jgi:hypothetical protein
MNETKDAVELILKRCKEIGNFQGDRPQQFLTKASEDIKIGRASALFPDPYRLHIAHAVRIIAESKPTDPGAAVGAVYLSSRMEVFFRILSGRLTSAGRWISESAATRTRTGLAGTKWGKELERAKRTKWQDERIKNLALTYKIMKLDAIRPAIGVFRELDEGLYSKAVLAHAGDTISDIGDRVEFARHRMSYGEFGDVALEAHFYALLTAIVFYNQ